jgi:hypothetical protein
MINIVKMLNLFLLYPLLIAHRICEKYHITRSSCPFNVLGLGILIYKLTIADLYIFLNYNILQL